jgi:surface protein
MKFLDNNIFLSISVMLLALTSGDAQTAITNANFKGACTAWVGGDTSTYGPIAGWDTSSVTDMAEAFREGSSFNDDISAWNTSSVTTIAIMFYNAAAFNQNIGSWDVSQVTDMQNVSNESMTCCLAGCFVISVMLPSIPFLANITNQSLAISFTLSLTYTHSFSVISSSYFLSLLFSRLLVNATVIILSLSFFH